MEAAELYQTFVVYTPSNANGSGGHIGQPGKGSLCGVEKRFKYLEVEQGMAGEFEEWFQTNEPWLCRSCLRIYRKRIAK